LYEFLSHLEDLGRPGDPADKTFRSNRGFVLLCQIPVLLDDPQLEGFRNAGAEETVKQDRCMERPILERLLVALADSRDLDDFYRRQVPLEDGTSRFFHGIAGSLGEYLHTLEAEYVQRVAGWHAILLRTTTYQQLPTLSGEPLYHIVEQGVFRMAETLGLQSRPESLRAVRHAMYPHLGYLVSRAVRYSIRAGANGVPVADANDVEDSYLAQHLSIDSERTLVTDDQDLVAALRTALRAFEAVTGDRPACGVAAADDFARDFAT
jgi:hypothetical protein